MKKPFITHTESFSDAIRGAFSMQHSHAVQMFLAVSTPIFISYALFWIAVASFIEKFNDLEKITDIVTVFSPSDNFFYFGSIALICIIVLYLIAITAAPVTIVNKYSSFNALAFDIFRFLPNMTGYALITAGLVGLGIILNGIILVIALVVVGLINFTWIDTFFNPISNALDITVTIVVLLVTSYMPFFIVEKKYNPIQSFKASVQLYKKHFALSTAWIVLMTAGIAAIAYPINLIPLVGGYLATIITVLIYTPFMYRLYKALTETPADTDSTEKK